MLIPRVRVLRPVVELAKRDRDAAEMLAYFGLVEALHDEIDRDRELIDGWVSKAAQRRTDEARRAIVRTWVSKRLAGEDPGELLLAASELTVAETYFCKAFFRPDDPRTPYWDARDAHGRFVANLKAGKTKDQVKAVGRVADDWRRAGIIRPDTTIQVHGYADDRDNENPDTTVHTSQAELANNKKTLPDNFIPQRVVVEDPEGMAGNRGVAFDAAQHFVGTRRASQIGRGPWEEGDFTRELGSVANESSGTDRRAYRRLNATGRAVQHFAPKNSSAYALGGMARLAGDLGPQAEQVLGPGLRRTAYRYRGTEKRPSAALVRNVAEVDVENPPEEERIPAGRAPRPGAARPSGSPAGSVIGYYESGGARDHDIDTESDQYELRARGDVAVDYFMRKLPNQRQTEISIAAGRVPPSQGAIIDRNGDVVTEAMGAEGDHYLPFDLKNLKRLQGGQYVRTRAMGGPSTEDIYTGLMTGARQIQVVSNSGVFTMEFDPDLRGGRRYSDKARSMVNRYEKLLDAIDNSEAAGIYAQDIDDDTKARMRRLAYQQIGGRDREALQNRVNELIDEERAKASFAGSSDAELSTRADARIAGEERRTGTPMGTANRAGAVREETGALRADEKAQRFRRFELNGEGYDAALHSLQQEFPYFIRNVDWEPIQDFAEDRGLARPNDNLPARTNAPDKGYVKPGQQNVTANAARQEWKTKQKEQQEARRATTTGTAGGGGGVGSTTPATPGTGATTAGTGASLREKVQFPLQPVSGLLTDVLRSRQADIKRSLGTALAPVAGKVTGMDLGLAPAHEEKLDDLIGENPAIFAQAVFNRKPDRGELASYLMSNPKALDRFHEGLREIAANLPNMEGAKPTDEQMGQAEKQLMLASFVSQGFANVPEDQLLEYGADSDDPSKLKPVRFNDIDALGDNPENYRLFEQNAPADMQSALSEMTDPPNGGGPSARGAYIAEQAQRIVNARRVAQAPYGTPLPGPVPPGVNDKNTAGSWLSDKRNLNRQADLNAAWSFLAAREAMTNLQDTGQTDGGGAGPKGTTGEPGEKRARLEDRPALEVAKLLVRRWVAEEQLANSTR